MQYLPKGGPTPRLGDERECFTQCEFLVGFRCGGLAAFAPRKGRVAPHAAASRVPPFASTRPHHPRQRYAQDVTGKL